MSYGCALMHCAVVLTGIFTLYLTTPVVKCGDVSDCDSELLDLKRVVLTTRSVLV